MVSTHAAKAESWIPDRPPAPPPRTRRIKHRVRLTTHCRRSSRRAASTGPPLRPAPLPRRTRPGRSSRPAALGTLLSAPLRLALPSRRNRNGRSSAARGGLGASSAPH